MSENAKAGDRGAAGMGMGNGNAQVVPAPRMYAEVEILRADGQVEPKACMSNVVVTGGLLWLINKALGNAVVSTAGTHLFLHYASVGSGNAWSNISASQVSGYGNNVPLITFASSYTALTASQSASYTFAHAGTQTLSGCGIHFYTTNTMSTNAATAGVAMYCYGTFSNGSRALQSNDTLNASLTLSYGTL